MNSRQFVEGSHPPTMKGSSLGLSLLRLIVALLSCLVGRSLSGQTRPLGIETRVYPAGLIPGARLDVPLGALGSFTASVGYNLTNRRSWGEHEHESGSGPGVGVGVSRSFRPERLGWQVGARIDAWTLEIGWRDPGDRSGHTRVLVLQPAGRVAYLWQLRHSPLRVEASANLGAELNLHTRGEAVGHGAIFLLGIGLLGIL